MQGNYTDGEVVNFHFQKERTKKAVLLRRTSCCSHNTIIKLSRENYTELLFTICGIKPLIRLQRQAPEGAALRGKLFIDGTYFCDTLERVGVQIPVLWYTVAVTQSPRFKRLLPIVERVPGRTGIRFLLILFLGGFALRIMRAIYLRK